jgi:hypothetical protein
MSQIESPNFSSSPISLFFRVAKQSMLLKLLSAVPIVLFWGAAVMGVAGCAETNRLSPAQEVGAFFVAGKEAQYLAMQCPTSGSVDLSAYAHLTGVKYPRTFHVDVLREPPSRPYKSFAVLEYDPAPQAKPEEVEAGLTDKAREIGADAIILCNAGPDQKLAGIPPTTKMQAVAIKYIIMSPPTKKDHS